MTTEQWIDTLGRPLAAITLLAWLLCLAHIRFSLRDFPALEYDGWTLQQKIVRRLWISVFLVAMAMAGFADPLLSWSETVGSEEAFQIAIAEPGVSVRNTQVQAPLPFYQYHVDIRTTSTGVEYGSRSKALTLGWEPLTLAILYFFLVVRWNPERPRLIGRWADRETGPPEPDSV